MGRVQAALTTLLLALLPATAAADSLAAGKTGGGVHSLIAAEEVIGKDVLNIHGEKVAEVQEVRIDPASGRVAWVVLQSTNVLEVDETTYAVPWIALDFSRGEGEIGLNVDPAKLMAVSRREYYMTDTDFAHAVQEFYGLGPSFGSEREEPAR